MNCLKCSNFWNTYIDENKCDKCNGTEPNNQKESEEKSNEKAHSLPG